MPRSNHTCILTEAQLRDPMTLPFDSNSLVNQ